MNTNDGRAKFWQNSHASHQLVLYDLDGFCMVLLQGVLERIQQCQGTGVSKQLIQGLSCTWIGTVLFVEHSQKQ